MRLLSLSAVPSLFSRSASVRAQIVMVPNTRLGLCTKGHAGMRGWALRIGIRRRRVGGQTFSYVVCLTYTGWIARCRARMLVEACSLRTSPAACPPWRLAPLQMAAADAAMSAAPAAAAPKQQIAEVAEVAHMKFLMGPLQDISLDYLGMAPWNRGRLRVDPIVMFASLAPPTPSSRRS